MPIGKSERDWREKSAARKMAFRAASAELGGQMTMRKASSRTEVAKTSIAGPLPIVFYSASADVRFSGSRYLGDDAAAALGFDAKKLVDDGDLWPSRIHGDDLPRVLAAAGSLTVDGTLSMEYRWRCADGSERRFLDQGILDRRDGQTRTIRGLCLDVTAEVSRPAADQQSPKSAERDGSLQLGNIAHEFNNMVSVIIWNLEPLTKSLEGSGKTFDRIQYALRAATECVELVKRLKASQ